MCPGRKASWNLIVNTCKNCEDIRLCDEGQMFLKVEHRFKYFEMIDRELKDLSWVNRESTASQC